MKIGLPCILLAVSAPILWSVITSHDDVFDTQNLLQVDASDLKTTRVSPHLETPIKEDANVIWCGTFQLAWNEVCTLVGEDIHFAEKEPETVAALNKKSFRKGDLDEASYVALADFVGNGVHGRIQRELHNKFHGQASPTLVPSPAGASRPQDIVAYSYLFKNLEFVVPFERIARPLEFGKSRVRCFGIDDVYRPGQTAMLAQVLIIDYKGSDDFVIELGTKFNGDRVVLAKTRPGKTLQETIAGVQDRMARVKPVAASTGDVLTIPKLNFDVSSNFRELLGKKLAIMNHSVAKDLQILAAVQNTRFQMDEKGVKLRSESKIVIGCAAESPPPQRFMIFDKPFLIMLQRPEAKMPYLALWIGNAELLQRMDGI
jgi:hypothetical protein